MSKCAVIVSANISDQEKVDAYKSVAGPIMQKYGLSTPPENYKVSNIIAGRAKPSFMLKLTFPDKEKALAAFDDPDYIAVLEQRDQGFGDLSIMLVE